jgi:hypothetical protein
MIFNKDDAPCNERTNKCIPVLKFIARNKIHNTNKCLPFKGIPLMWTSQKTVLYL